MNELSWTTADLIEIVGSVFDVPGAMSSGVLSRVRRLQYKNWPEPKPGRGHQASFSLRAVIDICVAFVLIDGGFDVDTAAAICHRSHRERGTLALKIARARGTRGTLLLVKPRRISSMDRNKPVIPAMTVLAAAECGGSYDFRGTLVIDMGSLGERVTEALIAVGAAEPAGLEVSFAQL